MKKRITIIIFLCLMLSACKPNTDAFYEEVPTSVGIFHSVDKQTYLFASQSELEAELNEVNYNYMMYQLGNSFFNRYYLVGLTLTAGSKPPVLVESLTYEDGVIIIIHTNLSKRSAETMDMFPYVFFFKIRKV